MNRFTIFILGIIVGMSLMFGIYPKVFTGEPHIYQFGVIEDWNTFGFSSNGYKEVTLIIKPEQPSSEEDRRRIIYKIPFD